VIEKESRLAAHQTGNNSGVIHSGLYYKPGSLKATNCTAGRLALERFCSERAIPYEALRQESWWRPGLSRFRSWRACEKKGEANGLTGIRHLSPGEIREIEPHAGRSGRAAGPADGDRRLPARHRGVRRGRAREGRRNLAVGRGGSACSVRAGTSSSRRTRGEIRTR